MGLDLLRSVDLQVWPVLRSGFKGTGAEVLIGRDVTEGQGFYRATVQPD